VLDVDFKGFNEEGKRKIKITATKPGFYHPMAALFLNFPGAGNAKLPAADGYLYNLDAGIPIY
jgi:hypothetical protein